MKNKGKFTLIVILIVLIAALAGGFFFVTDSIKLKPQSEETLSITIENAATSKNVFAELEEIGLIKNDTIAYYYAKFFHPSDFKAGDYLIPTGLDLDGVIDYLSDASNAIQNTVMITFIEGDWMKDFARKIAASTGLNADDLIVYWDNENNIRDWMEEYPFLTEEIFNEEVRHPLEGYFFPDTYEFYVDSSLEDVTHRLLDQTEKVYEKHKSAFDQSELSIHEIFTLASVVQYEASKEEDIKNVAGVFFNRLEDGMKLQSSVTVCYAIDIEPDEDWSACESNPDYDDPYNTYMYEGLPPGPILNPGEEAILAVLEPNENDYFYFIGDVCGDGTVYFAETYEEHLANVKEYLWCY